MHSILLAFMLVTASPEFPDVEENVIEEVTADTVDSNEPIVDPDDDSEAETDEAAESPPAAPAESERPSADAARTR